MHSLPHTEAVKQVLPVHYGQQQRLPAGRQSLILRRQANLVSKAAI